MISALFLSLLAAQPMELPAFADTDPATAEAIWSILEAQDDPAFAQVLAQDNVLSINYDLVEPRVGAFAKVVEECDPAEQFRWTNGVLGSVASFEAKLTCLDPDGRQKTALINIDGAGKVVTIEIRQPIVFKF